MATTTLRKDTKRMLIRLLRSQGYATYAMLLEEFDVYLTDDPGVIGYMVPDKALIVLNKKLSKNQVSVIIRHEILHEYLKHAARKEKMLRDNPDYINDHELANIAADFEISNRAYTDSDKATIRAIIMGDDVLSGLVTEDSYPGWENMTFEQMYKALSDERKQNMDKLQKLIDMMSKLDGRLMDDIEQQGNNAQSAIDDAQNSTPGDNANNDTDNNAGNSDPSDSDNDDTSMTGASSSTDDNKSDKDVEDTLSKLEKEVQDKQKELDKAKDVVDKADSSTEKGTFMSDSEQRDLVDVAARVEKIKDFFRDATVYAKVVSEAESPVRREKADKAAKAEAQYKNNPLRKFKLSLNNFIADQIGINREETWSRLNPSYEDSEFLIPGVSRQETLSVPLINVYHDVSGSFSDEAKTATAMSAIASLNEYVRKGKIRIEYYFFAEKVSKSKSEAEKGSWSTRGQPILNNIAETKPNNVIIITDSDISDCVTDTVVPGAVWLLFYDSTSQNLINHIRGKKQTKLFMINGEKR